jgi:hypothetical protein
VGSPAWPVRQRRERFFVAEFVKFLAVDAVSSAVSEFQYVDVNERKSLTALPATQPIDDACQQPFIFQ